MKRFLALAGVLLIFILSSPSAHAMAFGRSTVRSVQGEPLRAEIDIPELSAIEVLSVSVTMAPPAAFTESRFEYHPALHDAQMGLQRRPDGTAFLLLTTQRPIAERYLDVILVAQWATGRITRDYALLVPAALVSRTPTPPTQPTLAQTSTYAGQITRESPAATTESIALIADVLDKDRSTAPPPSAMEPSPPPSTRVALATERSITVANGETASSIATRTKSNDVSLDQMLVALMRANPEAFGEGKMHRLLAGSVIEIPDADAARQIPATEAQEIIRAQSQDFDVYRRGLASVGLLVPPSSAPLRTAQGQLEGDAWDKSTGQASPDRLTLAKDAAFNRQQEDRLTRQMQAQQDRQRAAELNKNMVELREIANVIPLYTLPTSTLNGAPQGPGLLLTERLWGQIAAAPAAPATSLGLLFLLAGIIFLQHQAHRRNKWQQELFMPPKLPVLHAHAPVATPLSQADEQAPIDAAKPAALVEPKPSSKPAVHIHRQKPCPCGSGKKYKHCHGQLH